MGLDMYLQARKHIEEINWDTLRDDPTLETNSPEAIFPKFTNVVSEAGLEDIATDIYGAYVTVTAAYWRKSNQIHAWFVRNVQNNVDDCGEYYVSHEKLEQLLNICREAYLERNPKLLAPAEGFFFGSTSIDDYYWSDIKRTINKLKKIINNPQYKHLSFYYSSSW